MRVSASFSETRNELLSDPELAAMYLEGILAEGDVDLFKLALKHVVDARPGGMTSVSSETHLNRESLYRSLSKSGNPRLDTLIKVLGVVGLRISVAPQANNEHDFDNDSVDSLAIDNVHLGEMAYAS